MADGDLTSAEFDIAFDFARPGVASYIDAAGVVRTAAANAPRFDHDSLGNPLGLLVETGDVLGAADAAIFDPLMLPDGIAGQPFTVFHQFTAVDGTPEYRAWYSLDPAATITSLLSGAGHHGLIGVVPGYRENKGGYVRYRSQSWLLPAVISANDGDLLGDTAGRGVITG